VSDPGTISLDYNATTPVDPRVLEAMLPYFGREFGNAASRHAPGERAAAAVERARGQVARALGADPREIVWTSGATEADNLAIKGVAASPAYRKRRRVVTVATEHRAVLEPCEELARAGYELTLLPVDPDGRLDLQRLADALSPETLLVSVMAANNETGVLHPIREIGALCHERRVLFHTDATQAIGRLEIDVERDGVDLLSLSGHKLYAPKGVGVLYVRRKNPRARCEPQLHGGGHERGLRSGTLNVPGIVALGAAVEIAAAERVKEMERLAALRDRLERGLLEAAPGARANGSAAPRLANTANVSFPDADAERLMALRPELALSSSAACTSARRQPSYVLGAMGASEAEVRGALRFSLGRFTTGAEVEAALRLVTGALPGARPPEPRADRCG
jgi:cysteine desulfurase